MLFLCSRDISLLVYWSQLPSNEHNTILTETHLWIFYPFQQMWLPLSRKTNPNRSTFVCVYKMYMFSCWQWSRRVCKAVNFYVSEHQISKLYEQLHCQIRRFMSSCGKMSGFLNVWGWYCRENNAKCMVTNLYHLTFYAICGHGESYYSRYDCICKMCFEYMDVFFSLV